MKEISIIGIDLAKRKFRLVGMNKAGKVVLRKWLERRAVLAFMGNIKPCLVGMEACASSHYWAREIAKLGHEVKLMPGQYVKPYVKTNKNDTNDAEGCAEAVTRPTMRFAVVKSEGQQVLSQLHRVRDRLIKVRTALGNEIRGFLGEFGIVVPKGMDKLRRNVLEALIDNRERLADGTRQMIERLCEELSKVEEEIKFYERKIILEHKESPASQRLDKVPGIGEIGATALVAIFGGQNQFKNGRHFAAYLGLVPSQHSTGGKSRLGRISKRGDAYIRKVLVQGAQAVVQRIKNKKDRYSRWVQATLKRCGWCKTVVAVANKNARIAWTILARDATFNAEFVPRKQAAQVA